MVDRMLRLFAGTNVTITQLCWNYILHVTYAVVRSDSGYVAG